MKAILAAGLIASITTACVMAAGVIAKTPPKAKARITCFNGKPDGATYCSGINFQPDGTLHATGSVSCGYTGQVSEVTWSFVKTEGSNDVYHFSRRFPSDKPENTTTGKTVEFSGKRVIVFQDDFQSVVIDPVDKP